jgi:Tfp pilus assembly protein PilV
VFTTSHSFSRRTAAFTLIEVMMAATILVVGFIGLIQAITIGSQMLATAHRQQIAIQIVTGEIDYLRASNLTAITNLAVGATYKITVNATGTAVTADPLGAVTRFNLDNNLTLLAQAAGFSLSAVRSNIRTDYEKIIYTVTWADNLGRPNTHRTEIYFGRNGLQLSYQKS